MVHRATVLRASVVAALLTAAGSALGQAPGDILFTDEFTDSINLLNAPGVWTPLVTFNDPNVRLAQITSVGKTWYVANGPKPVQDPSTGGIFRIDDLFGSPSVSTLASGDPLQNPIGLRYSKKTKQLITVNHIDGPINQPAFEGILAVDPANGNVTKVYEEQGGGKPVYKDGYRLTPDANSDDFFITCVNGGVYDGGPGDFNKASCIWRLSIDPNTLQGSVSLVADLSSVLADPLTFVRGITSVPGTSDLYIGDGATQAIYKMTLDNNGDFSGIAAIATGIQDPWEIVFNPYTKKLVYGEQDISTISQMNLDGSNIELLAKGVGARGIAIVPTPGGLALLGAAGVIGLRRRRA
jgi:hypothetical protein